MSACGAFTILDEASLQAELGVWYWGGVISLDAENVGDGVDSSILNKHHSGLYLADEGESYGREDDGSERHACTRGSISKKTLRT